MQYEPVCDVEYDLGALVDCFTLIHPLLHPSKVFSNSGYLNLTELGNQFISIIATTGYLNFLVIVFYGGKVHLVIIYKKIITFSISTNSRSNSTIREESECL